MKSETTLLEIYKWLSEGKKIRRYDFKENYFVHVVDNSLVDKDGDVVGYYFIDQEAWSLYQEPEEKVKWFRVVSFLKIALQPCTNSFLYASKEHFLKDRSNKESDYHWIVLEEVKYE